MFLFSRFNNIVFINLRSDLKNNMLKNKNIKQTIGVNPLESVVEIQDIINMKNENI